jgi:hypothetical protein
VFLPEPVQQDGIYWIDLIRDAASFAVKWRRGELGIRDWWRSVRMASSFALLDRRDFKPFVASIVRAISKAIIEGVSQVKAQLRRRP